MPNRDGSKNLTSIVAGVVLSTLFICSCSNNEFKGDGKKTPIVANDRTAEDSGNDQDPRYIMENGQKVQFNGGIAGASDTLPQKLDDQYQYLDVSGLKKNETLRSGGGPEGGSVLDDLGDTRVPFRHDLQLACEDNKVIEMSPLNPEQARIGTSIKGELCPNITHTLHILFIVDNSGSMGRHRDPKLGQEMPGNDPQLKDAVGKPTCGRLRAARAVIDMLKNPSYANVSTTISLISFASKVIENKTIKKIEDPLDGSLVNEKVFCETVIQGATYAQPGGLVIPGVTAATNYQEPLNAGEQLLKNLQGQKVVYFITDGNPNEPGTEAFGIAAGIKAGEQLRSNVANSVINALFLAATNPAEAQDILAKVSGDKSRVLLASNSNELEKKIIEFPPLGFLPGSGKGSLTIAPYPEEPLNVAIATHPQQADRWVYETEPFILHGKAGEVVDNIVKISATALDGKVYQATITVRYKQSN
jgi:hypothetical protein